MQQVEGVANRTMSRVSAQLLAGVYSQSAVTNGYNSKSRSYLVTLLKLQALVVQALGSLVLRYSKFFFEEPRRAVGPLISTKLMVFLSLSLGRTA